MPVPRRQDCSATRPDRCAVPSTTTRTVAIPPSPRRSPPRVTTTMTTPPPWPSSATPGCAGSTSTRNRHLRLSSAAGWLGCSAPPFASRPPPALRRCRMICIGRSTRSCALRGSPVSSRIVGARTAGLRSSRSAPATSSTRSMRPSAFRCSIRPSIDSSARAAIPCSSSSAPISAACRGCAIRSRRPCAGPPGCSPALNGSPPLPPARCRCGQRDR